MKHYGQTNIVGSAFGAFSLGKTWLTVERHKNGATLLEWFPGCKFSPKETLYNSVEDAKQAGTLLAIALNNNRR